MPRNRLDGETSPYLLQHRDNPVHWQPWDDEALARAKRENKPILLSIGYSACHWCHVMAHESFEDSAAAALMNDLFVNIKVDREERPDLDTIFQTALALLGQQGGWPLTMFLNSDGEPFWGGTYFPPTGRYGRPGFPDVLRTVHAVYTGEPEKVEQNRAAIASALAALSNQETAGDGSPPPSPDQIANQLLAAIDPEHGGIGGAPKFPQTPALELLWRAYCRGGGTRFRDAVLLSARSMCKGGIYDHLGGGFARYAVDARWLVPHFEKMLYDNALLIDLLAQLWQDTGDALFARRVEGTVGWALREMVAPEGGFTSALDADSEGEEGRFYTWNADEIDRLLGVGAASFRAAYDVTPAGNWEGRNILNRIDADDHAGDDAGDDDRFAAMRDVLLHARASRVRPYHDDKILADWNGLMIAGLANAGAIFDRPEWIDAATAAFAFVHGHMSSGGPGGDRLFHSYRDGRCKPEAFLDDYANMARAALALHEATGDAAYLAQAETWVATADRFYWDNTAGGYFFTASDGEKLIVRTKTAADTATPAGNGAMVAVLARLHALTATSAYRDRADAVAAAFGAQLARTPIASCTLLNAIETLRSAVQVVLVGDPAAEATRRLRQAVYGVAAPNRILTQIAPGSVLPPEHPAAGKTEIDGKPAAYVCVGTMCSLPITDADGLRAALAPR